MSEFDTRRLTSILDFIALAALASMVTAPFVFPIGPYQLPSFYHEWIAALFGVAAMTALLANLSRRLVLAVPAIAIAPAGLAVILLLQMVAGRMVYAEAHFLAILYLLWALMLMVVTTALRDRHGPEKVVRHVAIWILIGATLAALLGLLSFTGYSGPLLAVRISGVASGNLGQPNHFAHYLWLGVISLVYLRGKIPLSWPVTALIAFVLLFASSLTGSRSSLLYGFLLVGLALWRREANEKRLAFGLLGGYLLLLWLVPPVMGVNTLAKLSQDAGLFFPGLAPGQPLLAIRPTLIAIGWEMFNQSPWLGLGLGSFRWFSYLTADRAHGLQGSGEHAHNLFAQMLGEMGIAAALLVAIPLMVWTWRLLSHRGGRAQAAPETFWLAGMAGVAFIHSQLEYPLWYAYFLGLFAVVLALGDDQTWKFNLGRLPAVAMMLAGFIILAGMLQDNLKLEGLWHDIRKSGTSQGLKPHVAALIELRRDSLLAPQVDIVLTSVFLPTREALPAKLALCELSLHYRLARANMLTCPLLHELAGDHVQAERLWTLGKLTLGSEVGPYVNMLETKLTADELAPLQGMLKK